MATSVFPEPVGAMITQFFSFESRLDEFLLIIPSLEAGELVLRTYQEELVQTALEGKNCVIIAPTGSGKTEVAIYAAMKHISRREAFGEHSRSRSVGCIVSHRVEQSVVPFITVFWFTVCHVESGNRQEENQGSGNQIEFYNVDEQ
ncbi:hypothetical protein GCK72_000398 [Caenorhabditis remanei]|uniref:DEAD/DEAH-box helicase domain-containing protein n=1 Tax=Caenorhabditis remanei TaxID=31234 RepID=A0A6A5HPI6_CAERE|nr:hypothetical protein GCK72_000398 [Caenorhabditis remanei]KAF1768586.1 hypothetical protein GCK72_000398 [Caenorhabditis remanei]